MVVSHDSLGYIHILVANADFIKDEDGRFIIIIPTSVADELASDLIEHIADAERDL